MNCVQNTPNKREYHNNRQDETQTQPEKYNLMVPKASDMKE